MRYDNDPRLRTKLTQSTENRKSTFMQRTLLCFLLLIFCVLIKFYPDNDFELARNSINFIVNHNTDINKELEKFKALFKKDESLEVLNPVSEMISPSTSGKIIKGFGMQDASGSDFHYGVELSAEKNENIVCANDGTVSEVAKNEEYGSYIVITHSEEIKTLYGQLNEIIINVGDKVEKGQAIARANTETNSFYFELKRGETYLDPTQFISFKE